MTPPATRSGTRVSRPVFGAILILSLLWACGPLRQELFPASYAGSWPQLAAAALPLTQLAAIAALRALVCRRKWPRGRPLASVLLAGLGLFPVPALLLHFAAPWVSSFTPAALFTLVPVFSVVFAPYLEAPSLPVPNALPAALAALLGALLVFPVAPPASINAAVAFAALVLAAACAAGANCLAVSIFHAREPASPGIAIASAAGAATLAIASLVLERPSWQNSTLGPELLWAASIELPALLLLFWLMPRLSAVPLATRFVLGPLIAVAAAALLTQTPLAPRTLLGLATMAASCAYLLCAGETSTEPNSLLGP